MLRKCSAGALWALLFWALLLPTTYSIDVSGHIQWNDLCPSLERLGPSFASLDNGRYSAPITADGHFVIPDVTTGTYLLTILTHDFYFDPLRVDIFNNSQSIEIRPFIPGTQFSIPANAKLNHPIVLQPKHAHDYFLPPPNFNVLNMLQSPMVLLMIFGGAFMLAMPYLLKNMDLEEPQKESEALARPNPEQIVSPAADHTPSTAHTSSRPKGSKAKRR